MKRSILICLCLLLLPPALFAADPMLVYFENASGSTTLKLENGNVVKGADLVFGMPLPAGTTVSTGKGDSAEIRLPNGSIIRLSEETTFTIVTLQNQKEAKENRFALETGKFRAVAARVAGGGERYTFRTKNTACGVKGTDLGMEVGVDPATGNPLPAKAFVFGGLVELVKLDDSGNETGRLELGAGQWADAGAALFQALVMSPGVTEGFRKGLEFLKLDPKTVPGQTVSAAGPGPEGGPETPPEPDWMKALRDLIGLEIGTVTIGNDTYAKAILSPKFKLDDFKLSLYLPVIYKTNLFDPNDWYKPDGNNEWSFGTDASFGDNWWLRVGDIAYDLILKIKGLEVGAPGDPFFLKVGNLDDFIVGHGLIMRNYANDADFPAVRRIGFNLGVDTGPFALELVSNDLGMAVKALPEIAGTRLCFRPFHPFDLGLGITFLADWNPADGDSTVGDPMFFNAGLDLDLPIVRDKGFGLTLYADFAAMLPYFRYDVPGSPALPAGFAFDAIWYGPDGGKSFRNYGAAAGASGNVSLFEWRLEARYYTGKFKPALFDAAYDRTKRDYVNEVIDYLRNPADPANQTTTFGIYGEGAFMIEKVFSITVGYLAPLAFTQSGVEYGNDDFFQIKFTLEPKVIPVVGIFGSISFERTGFVSGFAGGLPALFDEHTVVRVTVGYPVVEGLSILFHYTTALALNPSTGVSSLAPSFTFETVIGF
ncbi:MAG: FecR domain-containing protein [Spirochaetales bacterium]|nr:FecR domain-containing protein [Spirochaetales bacterium]